MRIVLALSAAPSAAQVDIAGAGSVVEPSHVTKIAVITARRIVVSGRVSDVGVVIA